MSNWAQFRIQIPESMDFRGIEPKTVGSAYLTEQVNTILEQLGKEDRIKAAALMRLNGGHVLVYTHKFFLSGLGRQDKTVVSEKLGQYLIQVSKLDETTQASSIAHSPGEHKRISDAGYERAANQRMRRLQQFLGVKGSGKH